MSLPFNFCFYGTTQNSVFINNNGNISFGASYTTFSGVAFPSNQFVMIAPFWGDVDTRASGGQPGGEVWYKMTNSALIVNWVDVGYYNTHVEKRNTFQLIITDGSDPLVGNGNNVAFCYKDMQWTTGDASNGTNGFGGTPATVGANKGDGVDFIQFGRFDQAGNTYDGPFNNADGVSWLDNQSFVFNTCNSTNIPPIITGVDLCDTLGICVGDTMFFDLSFLAPEQTQLTQANVTTAPAGFTLVSNTTGVNADLSAYLVGSAANQGYNTIQFQAFDNGTPADTVYSNLVVYVDTTQLFPEITGDTTACIGQNITIDVGGGYDSYLWNTGTNDTNATNTVEAGEYIVTVTKGYCSQAADTFTVELVQPFPDILGDTAYCFGDSIFIAVADTFDSYLWESGDTDTNSYASAPGYFTLRVEKWNCPGFDSVLVVEHPLPLPVIAGDTFYCHDDSTMISIAAFDSMLWHSGQNTATIRAGAGRHWVNVIDNNGCENESDTFNIIQVRPDVTVSGDTIICADSLTILEAAASNVAFAWSDGATTRLDTVGTGDYRVTVTDAFGCIDTASVTVLQAPDPIASFVVDPAVYGLKGKTSQFDDQSSVSSGAVVYWEWSFGDPLNGASTDQNPAYVYQDTGQYSVTLRVRSDEGCWNEIIEPYRIVENVIAPNIITPNGDGINDYLVFRYLNVFPGSHLYIFNRWGELVYEDSDYRNNWDARNLNDGVYFYVLEVSIINQTEKGYFNIMTE